jgi:hypothetical protein
LLRHFQNKPNVHDEIVKQLAAGHPIEDATAEELTAVITLWCAGQPIDEVLQRIASRALEGSTGKLSSRFFAVLEQTVIDLERAALVEAAADLLWVGEVLAETHQEHAWTDRYRERRLKKVESRIRDLPFLKQRAR